MGNRAILTFGKSEISPCIYLHWNGGRASVEGFLAAATTLNIAANGNYTTRMDELAELIAKDFFDGEVGLTVYRQSYGDSDTDNGDNGVYVLDTGLNIVGREFAAMEEVDAEKTATITDTIIRKHQRRINDSASVLPA